MTENPFATPGHSPDIRPDAESRADVPRDRWDRYLLPMPGMEHMASSQLQAFTRVSTTTKALIQKKSLEEWRDGTIAIGLAKSPELIEAVNLAVAADDLKEPRKIAGEAFKRGGGKTRAELGTAMHLYTEKLNRGEDPGSIPDEHKPSLAAYLEVLDGRVQVLPQYLERRVMCPWSNAGTLDNIVMFRNDLVQPEGSDGDAPGEWDMRVADLKTGRDISKGWPEKLIQLWLYANADWMWDDESQRWVRMPKELRKDRALIIHVPMNGTAELYDVDLSGMDKVVEAAMIARRHNDEAKTKVRVVATADKRGPAYVAPEPDATSQMATQTAFALAPPAEVGDGGVLLTADGSGPLQPLAGEGKRGCGACGRTGHKRNSPKCWGENDPAKHAYQVGDGEPSGTTDATSQMPDNVPGQMPDATNYVTSYADQELDRLNAESQMPDAPLSAITSEEFLNAPRTASCPGHGAGWTNRGDGVWVCVQCGLPSAAVPTTVGEAVRAGQFPAIPGVTQAPEGLVVTNDQPELSVPPATVPEGWSDWVAEDLRTARSIRALMNVRHLAGQKDAWREDVHGTIARDRSAELLRQDIDQAPSAGEVLAIRDAAIQLGSWIPKQHDSYGQSRWSTLMMEGKN